MIDFTYKVTPSPAAIAKAFSGLRAEMRDWRDTWRAIHPVLTKGLQENFDSEGGALGVTWQALSQATLRSHGGGRQLLVMSGSLRKSLSSNNKTRIKLTKSALRVGTKHPLAGVHQFGWPRRNIPGRPFIGFNEPMRTMTQRMFITALAGKLRDFVRGVNHG